MQLIPSISILNGKINRLKKGDFMNPDTYDDSPVDLAKKFEDHGIEILHLLDLDGVLEGWPVNYHVLEAISGHTNLKIDFTGGVNTDGDISKSFEYGADYLTMGSIAVKRPKRFCFVDNILWPRKNNP